MQYTDRQKQEALDIYKTEGATAAAKAIGADKSTVSRWAHAGGVATTHTHEQTREARAVAAEQVARVWGDFRSEEAKGSGAAASAIRRRIMDAVEASGEVNGRNLQSLAVAYGIMVDKAELLSGKATERIETWAVAEVDKNLMDLVTEMEDVIREKRSGA